MTKYLKLADDLIKRIEKDMKPGDTLPSERKLADELGISRTTVRLAMQYLEQTGYVETSQGKNRKVKDRSAKKIDIGTMFSFTELMKTLNKVPASSVLQQEVIEADQHIASILELPSDNKKVYWLKRLRLADGEPMIIEDTYIPHYLFDNLFKYNFNEIPLYDVFQYEYNIDVIKTEEEVTAINSNTEILKNMNIDYSVSLLQIERITNNKFDQAIEYTVSVVRGDKFSYKISHHA